MKIFLKKQFRKILTMTIVATPLLGPSSHAASLDEMGFQSIGACSNAEITANMAPSDADYRLMREYFIADLEDSYRTVEEFETLLTDCANSNKGCSAYQKKEKEIIENLQDMRVYLSLSANSVVRNVTDRLSSLASCDIQGQLVKPTPNLSATHNSIFGLDRPTPLATQSVLAQKADSLIDADFNTNVMTKYHSSLAERQELMEGMDKIIAGLGKNDLKTSLTGILSFFDDFTKATLHKAQSNCRAYTSASQEFYHNKYLSILRKFPFLGYVKFNEQVTKENLNLFREELQSSVVSIKQKIDVFIKRAQLNKDNWHTLSELISLYYDNKMGKQLLLRESFVEKLINFSQDDGQTKNRLCSVASYMNKQIKVDAKINAVIGVASSMCKFLGPGYSTLCTEAFKMRQYYRVALDYKFLQNEAKYAFTKFENKDVRKSQNLVDLLVKKNEILKSLIKMIINQKYKSPVALTNLKLETDSKFVNFAGGQVTKKIDAWKNAYIRRLLQENKTSEDQLETISKHKSFKDCINNSSCMAALTPEADPALMLVLFLILT